MSFRLFNPRYRQDLDNYVVVFDAERLLYNAQQDRIQTQVQHLSNLVSFHKALLGKRY